MRTRLAPDSWRAAELDIRANGESGALVALERPASQTWFKHVHSAAKLPPLIGSSAETFALIPCFRHMVRLSDRGLSIYAERDYGDADLTMLFGPQLSKIRAHSQKMLGDEFVHWAVGADFSRFGQVLKLYFIARPSASEWRSTVRAVARLARGYRCTIPKRIASFMEEPNRAVIVNISVADEGPSPKIEFPDISLARAELALPESARRYAQRVLSATGASEFRHIGFRLNRCSSADVTLYLHPPVPIAIRQECFHGVH